MCIDLIKKVRTEFYGSRIDTDRFSHFLKIGVVSVTDFARRQSGAVENYDVIPRQDLAGWTFTGKTYGYAAIPLRIYELPLTKPANNAGDGRVKNTIVMSYLQAQLTQ